LWRVDRTADGVTILRQNALGDLRSRLEKVSRLGGAVRVIAPTDSVKIITARLNCQVYRGAAGKSLLSVERVGDDVYRLDRFGGRHIHGVRGQPRINNPGAVDPGVILKT